MTWPRPILIVAGIVAALICIPVFFAARFSASVLVQRVETLFGMASLSPARLAVVTVAGQFVSMLAAMGMTFGTFAGLRWVWRGTRLSK